MYQIGATCLPVDNRFSELIQSILLVKVQSSHCVKLVVDQNLHKCLMPLSTIYFGYLVAVSFIG